jgi:signal transduction histidine kinase
MLHEFLSRNRDEIIVRCEDDFRQRSSDRPSTELIPTIRSFVDEIIKAERHEAGLPDQSSLPGDTEEARIIGEQRFRRGFKIREVVMDYGAISQVIGQIAIEQDVELDPRSYRVLNQCLDSGLAQAITTYYELSIARGEQQFAEWLGYLSHELRNSLSSAVLAYGFIRSGSVGMESRTARVLEQSFNRLEALVSQTLVTVQLKSGVAPELESLDIKELIEDVQAAAIPERGVVLVHSVEDGLKVKADPRLVGSALTNLIQNALKFTRAKGHVHVRARRNNRGVQIDVEDECGGLGDSGEQLFEPFVQRTQKRRGVGLGLTITRNAIEAHGGTLSVRDLPGKGCVFTVHLPDEGS